MEDATKAPVPSKSGGCCDAEKGSIWRHPLSYPSPDLPTPTRPVPGEMRAIDVGRLDPGQAGRSAPGPFKCLRDSRIALGWSL